MLSMFLCANQTQTKENPIGEPFFGDSRGVDTPYVHTQVLGGFRPSEYRCPAKPMPVDLRVNLFYRLPTMVSRWTFIFIFGRLDRSNMENQGWVCYIFELARGSPIYV
jgi:hypothetical protein